MKSKRKSINNKELERRTNIMMMEIQEVKHYLNTIGATLSSFIKMDDKEDALKEYMSKQSKEAEDVRSELQESSS